MTTSSNAPLWEVHERLREQHGLQEVISVPVKRDSEKKKGELGCPLARACAGYLQEKVVVTAEEGRRTRVGIGWGFVMCEVAKELEKRSDKAEAAGHGTTFRPRGEIMWSPLVGNLGHKRDIEWEPTQIAERLSRVFGGTVDSFNLPAIIEPSGSLPKPHPLVSALADQADVILTSASPWNHQNGLFTIARAERQGLPRVGSDVAGLMSGVFLTPKGTPVPRRKTYYHFTGLDFEGFQSAAKRGAVVLVAGGEKRRAAALAALRGHLVSVLITTNSTARWLYEHQ